MSDFMAAKVDAYVDEVWPDVLADIHALVAVPSVSDPERAVPGAPFGAEVKQALDVALAQCARLGMVTSDHGGNYGIAQVPYEDKDNAASPDGTPLVAVMSHVDVVPAGEGWDGDPFTVRVRDGWLIGRGVLDDKGPAVLSAYAARFFLETGTPLPYRLQLIIGCDEETGMSDVDHYLEEQGEPDFLFTPDAVFPVCCGEKGRLVGTFASGVLSGDLRIVEMEGGTAVNAIPGSAWAKVHVMPDTELPEVEGFAFEPCPDAAVRIVACGIGGHASRPEGTVNAIGLLVDYLIDNDLAGEGEKPFLMLLHDVFASTDGSSLGVAATDPVFDPLTCIGGTIELRDGHMLQTVDVRYPASIDDKQIAQRLQAKAAEYDATFACDPDLLMVPYVIDPNKPEVQALVRAYNTVTHSDAKPTTLGGGTYARHFANAVSFGPIHDGSTCPPWVGPMHGANEGFSENALKRALKIYIQALLNLREVYRVNRCR